MRFIVFLVVILGGYLPTLGFAAQLITPAQAIVDISAGSSVDFKPVYTVSLPEQSSTVGLGLRVHFNSKALRYKSVAQLFATGLQPVSEVMADIADWDADTTTDSYILLAWLDLKAQWPGTNALPLTLCTMQFQAVAGFKGATYLRTSAAATADNTPFQSTPMKIAVDQGINVKLKTFLQGVYDESVKQMRDSLRVNKLLPLTQPYETMGYQGSETTTNAVMATVGYDAPVDWVLVKLHDTSPERKTVAAQAALVQRDGNIAEAKTNQVGLAFPTVAAGNYYVSLHHRNHLSVMTNVPVALGSEAITLDFTALDTPLAGTNPTKISGSTRLLWAGDINQDIKMIGEGPNNDKGLVLNVVLADPENNQASINHQYNAYSNADINLDGKVIYAGPSNDINLLLSNILIYPGNTTSSTNYILTGNSLP